MMRSVQLFEIGDRVKVLVGEDYGKLGNVHSFSLNRHSMAVRLDGEGEDDDHTVYEPDELAKV